MKASTGPRIHGSLMTGGATSLRGWKAQWRRSITVYLPRGATSLLLGAANIATTPNNARNRLIALAIVYQAGSKRVRALIGV